MTWLSANAGTIVVLLILVVVVGLVIRKMILDRRKGITACDSCVSADACSIHAAGKSCGTGPTSASASKGRTGAWASAVKCCAPA